MKIFISNLVSSGKVYSLITCILLAFNLCAQVGIGTLMPDSSSILELKSTHKGFLMPRMTTDQRDSIAEPSVGLQIFNMDDQCIDIYDSVYWIKNCGYKQVGLGDSIGTNVWVPKGNVGAPSIRRKAFSFTIQGKVYVGTGQNGTNNYEDFWEYNPNTNVWTQKANLPGGARYGSVGFSIGSKGYAGLGENFGVHKIDFYEYDPTTNSWTSKANFGGAARREAIGFVINSKGYVGTGFNGTTNFQDIWEYNPVSNSWASKANFPGAGRSGAVSFTIGSNGYVGTGFNGTYLSDFYAYDPVNNLWSTIANFGGGMRRSGAAFSFGSKGYVGTGLTAANLYSQDFWEYDPITNSWIIKTEFGGGPRQGAVGFSLAGKGYFGTGALGSSINSNDIWEYRPSVEAPVYAIGYPDGGYAGINDGLWTRNGFAMHATSAQYVGIGTSDPDTNAILDLNSTSKGLLIPRMTTAQRLAIPVPADGLLVFDLDKDQFYYYSNQSWITFLGSTIGSYPGDKNLAIGDSALAQGSSIGIENIAIGSNALYINTTGEKNVAIGPNALFSNTNGYANVGIGINALYANTTGRGNIAIGRTALTANVTGLSNVGIGSDALLHNTFGDYNLAIGTYALLENTVGEDNIGLGFNALHNNSSGESNIGIGSSALYQNTIGSENISIGNGSMYSNSSGQENVAIGSSALSQNSSGNHNVAVGRLSLYQNYSGVRNTGIGNNSLLNNYSGVNNSAVGDSSLFNNISGDANTAVGRHSLLALTIGDYNTGIGSSVSSFITTGDLNTAVGRNCLDNISIGNNNTALGYSADVSAGGAAFTNVSVIGNNATATASHLIKLGNSNVSVIGGAVNWSIISDARYKKDVSENVPGLEFIRRLRPVTYHLDVTSIAEHLKEDYERDDTGQLVYGPPDQSTIEARQRKSSVLNTGFIAQEVETAAQTIGYEFYGVHAPDNPDDHYSLSYATFTVPLVKAVQELETIIATLQEENTSLRSQIDIDRIQYSDQLRQLQVQITALAHIIEKGK